MCNGERTLQARHAVLHNSRHCLVGPHAGEVTAAQALVNACEECSKVCKHIGSVFDAAVQEYQQEHPGSSQQQKAGQDVEMSG